MFIFGFPWGKTFKPDINWAEGRIKGPHVQVETLLLGRYQRVKTFVDEKKVLKQKEQEDIILKLDHAKCSPWSRVTPEETQGGWVEINQTHNAVEMAHKYAAEHGMQEVTLPQEFKHHMALFSNEEANKFPPLRPWDHKIELTENAPEKFNCKIYPMSLKEQEAEDKFLDENLAKGYSISQPWTPPMDFQHSWCQRKTQKNCGTLSIIDHLTRLPERMSLPYLTLHNVSKTFKAWKSLANLMSDRDTTIFAYDQKINGKELSKYDTDSWNQK
jgi:hypothetical protein